jgi:hypothetical protein
MVGVVCRRSAIATFIMSIDKESSGVPQFDVHRRTTKVNLAMMGSVLVFFIIVAAVIVWFAAHRG